MALDLLLFNKPAMKTKYAVITAIILGSLFKINAQLYYVSGTFRVISSETYSIYPGVAGANIQHNTTIKIVFKRNTDFKSDSFWMNGYVSNTIIKDNKGNDFTGNAKKGDTLILICNYQEPTQNNNLPPELQTNKGSKEEKPRVKHSGKLLFRYGFEKPQYFFSIRTITKKDGVYAP